MSPRETYETFFGAEVIVGMHGSGLLYSVYAEQSATVIELHSGNDWQIIMVTAEVCGHRAVRVPQTEGAIDLEALKVALRSA
jgi:capsular polysaccharide biosynthesis protein